MSTNDAGASPVQHEVRPASEASGFHNPWRTSLENCMTGDNFLRTQEWHDLIEELDDLYRYRCGQHSALQDAYAQGREDEREDIAAWLEGQGQPGYAHEVRHKA